MAFLEQEFVRVIVQLELFGRNDRIDRAAIHVDPHIRMQRQDFQPHARRHDGKLGNERPDEDHRDIPPAIVSIARRSEMQVDPTTTWLTLDTVPEPMTVPAGRSRVRAACDQVVEAIGHRIAARAAEPHAVDLGRQRLAYAALLPIVAQLVGHQRKRRDRAGGLGLHPAEAGLHVDRRDRAERPIVDGARRGGWALARPARSSPAARRR